MNWNSIFDEVVLEPPASPDEIAAFITDLAHPLSAEEIVEINRYQLNPWPVSHEWHSSWHPFDPGLWRLPSSILPESYKSFLAWSRAPWVRKGARQLGHLGTTSMREYLLAYHFPQYLPGVLPIGLDGGGIFVAFDTRSGLSAGEYPIIAVESGVFDFECSRAVASSFLELCTGTSAIQDFLYPRGAA